MRYRRFFGRFLALGLVAACLGIGTVAQASGVPQGTAGSSVTLADLGQSDITITGLNGAASVYVPLPTNWVMSSPAQVTIVYQASPLLDNQRSSLTILANGLTVTSVHPEPDGKEHTITFEVPSDRLQTENLRIQFMARLFLGTDVNCPESNNPGQWLTVKNTSSVTFVPIEDLSQPTLDLLPNVIAVQHPIGPRPEVIFVLPDNPSQVELSAAARVAARFGFDIRGTIFPFLVETTSTLNAEQRNTANMVVIGTPERQPLITDMSASLPVSLVGTAYTTLPGTGADSAVIQIMGSPWSPPRKVLLISGTSDKGLDLAGKAFADRETYNSFAVTSRYAIFDKLAGNVNTQTSPWASSSTVSLADLGFSDQRLEGIGVVTAGYYFRLPPGWLRDPGSSLTLHLAYSTALTTDSHITVSVNGEPVGVYPIEGGSADKIVTFALPDSVLGTSATGAQSQSLNVAVEARNFVELKNCEPTNNNAAWVTVVASDSTLYVPHHLMAMPDLMAFPYPFAGVASDNVPAAIILPPSPGVQTIAQGLDIASTLGQFGASSFDLHMAAYDPSLESSLADANLIALGVTDTHPLAQSMLSGEGREVSLASDALDTARMGVLLEKQSPWNPARTALLITGRSEEALANAINASFDSAPPVGGSGSLAVVEPNQSPHIIYGEIEQVDSADSTPEPGSTTSAVTEATPGAVTAIPAGVTPAPPTQSGLPIPSGQLVAVVVTPLAIIGLIAVVWALWSRRTK